MRVGYVLPMGEDTRPGVPASTTEIMALARDVEAAGFDSVWTFDHLLVQEDGSTEVAGTWEAWTMLTAIAAITRTVKLGVLVSCTGFREPGVLAKMAHTLQEISDGRLILGVGAGWHEPEYRAFGIPFDHKVDRFAEAMTIITALIRDGRSDFTGTYYRTVDAPLLPAVPDRPKPPILIGGRGPRMLGLVAEHADAWNTAWFGAPGPKFHEQHHKMIDACTARGRDPKTLDVTVGMYIKPDDGEADSPGVPANTHALREAFEAWRATGVAEVLCWMDPPTMAGFRTLTEALPA